MSDFPISGHTDPAFSAVREVFEANFSNGEELGAGFAVYKDDELVVSLVGGWADRQKTHPWTSSAIPTGVSSL